VFDLHRVYSAADTQAWAAQGCVTAGIGCLECKKPLIDAIVVEVENVRARARDYEQDRDAVAAIINDGCEKAREAARETMQEVRSAMGLQYR